jgi:hypothetical protein
MIFKNQFPEYVHNARNADAYLFFEGCLRKQIVTNKHNITWHIIIKLFINIFSMSHFYNNKFIFYFIKS